jgi:hypothetical protein
MRYLLPCACGNQIPVEPKDAGLTVTCSCGAQLKVPNTRGMAALPRLGAGEDESVAASSAAGWGLKNQLLTAGLISTLFGVALLAFAILTSPSDPSQEMARQEFENIPLARLESLWQQYATKGLEPIESPQMAAYEQERDEKNRMTWIGGVVAIGGLGLLAASAAASNERR